MLSTIQKTFVFLHQKPYLATSRTIRIKNMKILHTFRLNRIKWRHWLLLVLLILVTLTKMIPLWGFIYTTRIYPIIGTLLSPISGFFLCRRRYLHRSQHCLGYLLSHLRDRIEKEACQAILLPGSEERLLSQEEGCIRKSGRIPALGICLVLHRLGIKLLPAEYLC